MRFSWTITTWLRTLLGTLALVAASACQKVPTPRVLPPGIIPLKVATLSFGDVLTGCVVGPLDGTSLDPTLCARHSTYVVPFDPKLPTHTFQVYWTPHYDGAFSAYTDMRLRYNEQRSLKDWEYHVTARLTGPIPANPAYLLVIFSPDVKAEDRPLAVSVPIANNPNREMAVTAVILSEAQMNDGYMEKRVQEFLATWPNVIREPKKEENS